MAEKRMFSLSVVDTDWFLDMPLSTQALYFHLSMRADDDGFVDSPKSIIRKVGANENDFQLLIVKRFILKFESGVIVIKHWRLHNTIQKDRYHETRFKEEFNSLEVKENKSYTEKLNYVDCIQGGNNLDTNCLLSLDTKPNTNTNTNSLDILSNTTKVKENNIREKKSTNGFVKPTLEEIKAYCQEKKLSVDCEKFFAYYESNGWKVGKNPMKNWKASLNFWQRNQEDKRSSFGYVDDDPTLI